MNTNAHDRGIVEGLPDGIEELTPDGAIVAANAAALAQLGLPSSKVLGQLWPELWPEHSRAAMRALVQRSAQGYRTCCVGRRQGSLGDDAWQEVTISPLLDASGRTQVLLVHSRDVTERVRLEEALDQINLSLRHRLSASDQAAVRAHARLTTMRWALRSVEDRAHRSAEREVRLKGRLEVVEASHAALEATVIQAKKGEAIGQMVAGVAHDFNNMLQTVLSALDLLGEPEGPGTERQRKALDLARAAVRQATMLTQRLLAFGREQPYAAELLDLCEVVTEIVPLLQHAAHPRASVSTELQQHITVRADRHLIEQALMNLVINARDACEPLGDIRLRTGRTTVAGAGEHGRHPGDFVFVEVTDTGRGMTRDVVDRMFEPYFTTKAPGQGTGLGMVQIDGLMRRAGGFIDVQSEVGKGTTVRLMFPQAREASAEC